MSNYLFILLILFINLCTSAAEVIAHKNELLVYVEQGWLQGEVVDTVTGDGYYYSFKGVPYAAAPIGNLRFMDPTPPLEWDGIRDATKHGPVCVQKDIYTNKYKGKEDCLYLNVYSPILRSDKTHPVMFYIHGGGYKTGSGNIDNYGPDFLIQHGVVLVTINYRLDALGFLSLESKTLPGNLGLKDQSAALKWVSNNINNFGGDPDNITIFGQSAGGAAVILHTLSPMSQNLFKRAISMSGVPNCDWSIPFQPRKRAFALGKEIGITTNDEEALLQYFRSVPAEMLVGKTPNVLALDEITGNGLKMLHFTPVLEKYFGENNFIVERSREIDSKIDLLIGFTNGEGIFDLISSEEYILDSYSKYEEMLVPTKILYKISAEKSLDIAEYIHKRYFGDELINKTQLRQLLSYMNDATYIYDIMEFVTAFSEDSTPKLYMYKFSGVSDRNIYGNAGAKYNLTGASHMDDTVYLFDPKRANLTIKKNSREYKMVQQTCKLFTNFAKYGNPTPDYKLGVFWPPYTMKSQRYLDIGENLTVNEMTTESQFWQSVFRRTEL